MPMPAWLPAWQMYAGNDQSIRLDFTDDSDDPLDLSGVTEWKAQVRRTAGGAAYTECDVDNSQAAAGTIFVRIPRDRHLVIASGDGVWDLQGIEDGALRTFVRGPVAVTRDVTR